MLQTKQQKNQTLKYANAARIKRIPNSQNSQSLSDKTNQIFITKFIPTFHLAK